MTPGELDFTIRNCQSYKEGRTLDCLISNVSELQNPDAMKSFDEIKYSTEKLGGVFYETFIIKFSYNIR